MTVYGVSSSSMIVFDEPTEEDDEDDFREIRAGRPLTQDGTSEDPSQGNTEEELPFFLDPYIPSFPAITRHSANRLTQARRWMDTVIPKLIPVYLRVLRESRQLHDFSRVSPRTCSQHCSQKKIQVLCISIDGMF